MKKFGRYLIEKEIGHGGMGIVYQAYDPSEERRIALKILPESTIFGRTAHRFQQEIKHLRNLEHPHIIPVYETGVIDERPYLAMRLVTGKTLKQKIIERYPQQPCFSIEETIQLLTPIAEALDFAHRKDVIHRDIKPSNILFDAEGATYLADFGLAEQNPQAISKSRAEWDTNPHLNAFNQVRMEQSFLIGTPFYMSPEHIKGEQLTNQGDLYGLGVVIFEMLTGGVPYPAEYVPLQLAGHIEKPIPLIEECCPALPARVQLFFDKALHKEPAERYHSAAEMLHSLQTMASAPMPVEAKAAPLPIHRLLKWALLCAGLVASCLVGLFLLNASLNREDGGEMTAENPPTISLNEIAPLTTVSATDIPPEPTVAPSTTIFFACYTNNVDNICQVDIDGSNFKQLTTETLPTYYPSSSADGQSVYYSSRRDERAGRGVEFNIYRKEVATGAMMRLTSDQFVDAYAPEESPDGSMIVFTGITSADQEIWIMNRDGSNPRIIVDSIYEDIDPIWHPDGDKVIFASARSGQDIGYKHYIVDIQNGDVTPIEEDVPLLGGRSSISPDGKYLAVYAGEKGSKQIYSISLETGVVRRLTHTGNNLAPDFSPDGEWITFASYNEKNQLGLAIIRPDGTGFQRLPQNYNSDWQPRWKK